MDFFCSSEMKSKKENIETQIASISNVDILFHVLISFLEGKIRSHRMENVKTAVLSLLCMLLLYVLSGFLGYL